METISRFMTKSIAVAFILATALLASTSAQAQSAPFEGIDVLGEADSRPFAGQISISRFALGPDGLLVDGVVSGELDGRPIEQAFYGVPVTLTSHELTPWALSPDDPNACDVLFLDLGPLDLNLLGIQLELAEVILDLDALGGPGNLLGNLLCALTGLLDSLNLDMLVRSIIESLIALLNSLLSP